MAKKKSGNVVSFLSRALGKTPAGADRKMSEIIKEMALRLMKRPGAVPTMAAVEASLLLAGAAWNFELGEPALREKHREMLKVIDWDGKTPWAELISADTEKLIEGLVAYKRATYPNDRRRIVGVGMSPEGNVQVQWLDDRPVTASFGTKPVEASGVGVASGRPMAEKLVAKMKREVRGRVVAIKDVIAGKAAAAKLQKTAASPAVLSEFHPAHAAYVFAQNQLSVMSEQLTALPEMAPFADIIAPAEDEYMPGGPPMSPLTASFFSCWAFFDACVGPANETIGTTVLEVGAAFGMDAELLRVIGLMQQSRMGIYVQEGTEGSVVVLRELVTDAVHRAIVPAGYRGRKGELWYARVFPSPIGGGESVVFTTPYILMTQGIRDWEAYFRRVLPDAPKQARLDAYERHMKYGPTRAYWNDFVFEGYVNYQLEAVFLRGLPDVPESRPHAI